MAIVTDPTTGAVYDDGQPDPNAGTWVTDAAGVPTYTPPPDVQAMIDQVMNVPQANLNAPQAPTPDPRGLPPPVVDPRDVSGGVNPAGPVDHAPLPPAIIGNDYTSRGGADALASDRATIAATPQPGGEPQVDPTTGALVAPAGGVSASYGSKQYSPEVEAAINKSPMVRAAFEGFATAEQRAAADAEAQLASGAAMADAARDTEQRQFEANAAELLAQQTAIENHARDMEQARVEHERRLAERTAIADQAKQRYLADAAVARSMVSDPYANLRGAGGGMAMLAMAGSAWLANMGPGSPVMPDIAGMIENVIQNTRATQDSNRANAWKTVESDDNLWNLARQGVDDEEMAYSRYRGFLTEAYHTQVAVTAAKFAGQKAAAAHQGALDAIAAANQEYADGVRQTTWNKMAAIDKERNDLIAKILDNAQRTEAARISAGPQYARIAADEREAEAKRQAAAKDALVFIDPVSKKAVGVAQSPSAYELGTKTLLGATATAKAVARLQELSRGVRAKINVGPLDAVTMDQATQDFNAAYEDLISAVALARTGQTASDKIMSRIDEIYPRDKMLSGILGGDIDYAQTWAQRTEQEITNARDSITSLSKVGESDAESFLSDHMTAFRASGDATNRRPDSTIPTLQSIGSGRNSGGRSPDMFMPVEVPTLTRGTYDALVSALGQRALQPRATVGGAELQFTSIPAGADRGGALPAYLASLYGLWALTSSPDEAQAQAARDALRETASVLKDEATGRGGRSEAEASQAARYFLNNPYTDPVR